MANPEYYIDIDFSFVVSSDATLSDEIVQFAFNRRIADAFNPISVGQATIVLDNYNGDFSPENKNSPYYPLTKGGRVTLRSLYNSVTYYHFIGTIDSYSVETSPGKRITIIQATDEVKKLKDVKTAASFVDVPIDFNVSSLFNDLISTAGIGFSDVAVLSEVIPFPFFLEKDNAQTFDDLLRLGDFKFFVASGHYLTVKNNFYTSSATPVASFNNNFLSISYESNFGRIINKINVRGFSRLLSTSINTCAYNLDVMTIPGSSSIGFWLHYVNPITLEENTPCLSMISVVASTDYLGNTLADGTGINRTVTPNVTFFSTSAVCSLTNPNSGDIFLTKFQLRGYAITKSPIRYQIENSSSQGLYGKREYTLDHPFIQKFLYASSYARYILSKYKERDPILSLAVKNDFAQILPREIGDVVVVVESNMSVGSRWSIQEMTQTVTLGSGL